MAQKKPEKKKALLALLEKADKEDAAQFKDKADRLMDLAFPTKRDEVRKAKQGQYHLLKGGSKDAAGFEKKWPHLLGVNAKDPLANNVRIIRREFAGEALPFGFLAGIGAHEGGHDIREDHEPPPGLMQSSTDLPTEGEDTFETALRQALESGRRALDEEHLANNPPSEFAAALKALGIPDPRDSRPSKAVNLELMLESNPPAERYEFQAPAWEDRK